jgi:hypothetical protein
MYVLIITELVGIYFFLYVFGRCETMCEFFFNMYELLSNEGIRDILQTQIINFPTWSDMFPIFPTSSQVMYTLKIGMSFIFRHS